MVMVMRLMRFRRRRERPGDPPRLRDGVLSGLLLVALLVPVVGLWRSVDATVGPSVALCFLVPVIIAAAVGGWPAGIIVTIAAIFAWDWFFIQPPYTVTVYYPRDLMALAIFLAVALLVGRLSAIARRRTAEALRRAQASEALYELSMALIAERNLPEILPHLTHRACETFGLQSCAVVLPDDDGKVWRTAAVAGQLPSDLRVEESRDAAAVASWVNIHGRASRLGEMRPEGANRVHLSPGPSGAEEARFLPLRMGEHAVGVLELVHRPGYRPDPEQERLLSMFANTASIALEQAHMARERRAAAVARASDHLKSTLLSSVSHDLRTPLATIKAAASSLLQDDVQWSEEDRRAFAADINAEADRLTRLVGNLLDLSRIEAGALFPHLEWEDLGELVERVVQRSGPHLSDHLIDCRVAADVPAVRLDAVQIEQVLTNLLDNAAKYSPRGSTITVTVGEADLAGEPAVGITVADQGIGIPLTAQRYVFDKFYRVAASSRRINGTGMGLAVVKGLVEAHGGQVSVKSSPGHGSTFALLLPVDPQAHPNRVRSPVHQGEVGK